MVRYFGTYNGDGYEICRQSKTDDGGVMTEVVYSAGNCRHDSAQSLPRGSEGTLGVGEMGELCLSTGCAMAAEAGGKWLGCDYDADVEAESDAMYEESRR